MGTIHWPRNSQIKVAQANVLIIAFFLSGEVWNVSIPSSTYSIVLVLKYDQFGLSVSSKDPPKDPIFFNYQPSLSSREFSRVAVL